MVYMENEIKAEFFMERDYEDVARFGCRVGRKQISFFPEIEISEDGVYTGPIGISSTILSLEPDEIKAVRQVFEENNKAMSSYFSVIIGDEWGPTPKSIYESVLTLELTDEERLKVQTYISRFTYIYLIKDERTGYTKIGRSDSPLDRLKNLIKQDTLMPEANNFTMLFAWADYAYKEKQLHKQFESVRVRGEWFNLDASDINEIWDQFSYEKDLITGKSKNDLYEESLAKWDSDQEISNAKENTIN